MRKDRYKVGDVVEGDIPAIVDLRNLGSAFTPRTGVVIKVFDADDCYCDMYGHTQFLQLDVCLYVNLSGARFKPLRDEDGILLEA